MLNWLKFSKKIDNNSPESMLIYKELIAKVDDVIEKIPRKCKRVFLLSRKKQFTPPLYKKMLYELLHLSSPLFLAIKFPKKIFQKFIDTGETECSLECILVIPSFILQEKISPPLFR